MNAEDLNKLVKLLLSNSEEVKMLMQNVCVEIQTARQDIQLLKLEVKTMKDTLKSIRSEKGKQIIESRPLKKQTKLENLEKPRNLQPNTLEYRLWNEVLPNLIRKENKEKEKSKKDES